MSTRASVGATFAMALRTAASAAEEPTISEPLETESFFFSVLVSLTSLVRSRALRTVTSRRLRSGGLERKSYAPFLVASTAVSMLPWAETMMKAASAPMA